MGITYCTREDVKESLDIKTATRSVENLTRRVFYPTITTRYFDFPDGGRSSTYRQWIDEPAQLISATSVTSGGTTIVTNDYFLEPVNEGPPFNRIEIDLASTANFDAEATHQRQTVVAGTWGY